MTHIGPPNYPYAPGSEEQPVARKRWPWIVVGAVLVVVAVVATFLMVTSPSEPPAQAHQPETGTPSVDPSAVPLSPATTASPPANQPVASGQKPGTIRLPEGGTATLVRKELGADGVLPIPEDLNEATWWGAKLGAVRGAALLSGHVNWNGQKGPFEELWRMQEGHEVTVVDVDGGQWVYRAVSMVTVHKDKLAEQADQLFSQGGKHRLVLVTCGGEYVGGNNGYADNRVITAELVSRA